MKSVKQEEQEAYYRELEEDKAKAKCILGAFMVLGAIMTLLIKGCS